MAVVKTPRELFGLLESLKKPPVVAIGSPSKSRSQEVFQNSPWVSRFAIREKPTATGIYTSMRTFYEYLADLDLRARLWLIETYFSFDAAQYNQLFDDELGKLSVSSPEYRDALERMQAFNWVGYIAKSLRNSGYRDKREVQERTHDIVVKMLAGGLFRDYDERHHGPLDLRFKRAVANAIRNMVEKQRNARRLVPTVSIGQERGDDLPDRMADDGEERIEDFRQLVRNQLGELGIAVLDARLSGEETQGLVGREDLGSPGRYVIKRVVQEIKALAREYAQRTWRSGLPSGY